MASKRKLEEKRKRAQQRKFDQVKPITDRLLGRPAAPKDSKWQPAFRTQV